MRDLVVILFHDFETLDAFGPVEVLGRLTEHFKPEFYSLEGGLITSSQRVRVETRPFRDLQSPSYVMLIPGGMGTRELVNNKSYVDELGAMARLADFVLTVCTGSILFSKTGLLDGKKATSNKRAFAWTQKVSPGVQWVKKARWVRDGNLYTSSGVCAGIDMTLGFVSDLLGYETAKQQSNEIEYDWHENPEWDPFAELY